MSDQYFLIYIPDNFFFRWCGKGLPLHSIDYYASVERERDTLLLMDGYRLSSQSNNY